MNKQNFKVDFMDVTEVFPYSENPRQIGPDAVAKVAKSIKEYGFASPIIVNAQNVILAGHTRLQAALSLGLSQVPVHVRDNLTDEQERAYRLADNRVAEESQWDFPILTAELEALQSADFDLFLTGFDPHELNKLLSPDEDPYADGEKGSMAENFGAPPFSVLDTRQGYWQDRKKNWDSIIGDQGESRENTLAAKGSIMEGIGSVSLLDATLAEIMCRWFGKPDFHAFDCFAGDTVFGFVAGSMGMNFTGIELRKEQADLNNKRVSEAELSARYINDDALNMNKHIQPESMDFFFSCPPYADLEQYSDDPKDLSNMSHDDFFEVYKSALENTYSRLKPNRFAVVVTSEVRSKAGNYIGLVPRTIEFMVSAGYHFWNEMVLINSAGTLPLRAGKSMNASRKVGRMHQNVLVFYKGDPKKIKANMGSVTGGFGEHQDE